MNELNSDGTAPPRYRNELERLTYSVREAAHILGIGRETCYQLIRSNELRAIRVGAGGTRWRVPRFELEAYLRRELERNNVTKH